ncbi:polysaccharide deacetylase family protein [Alkalimarinus coralli]|uniref:polysaccharide deacetylase family protein n=1 Tax=Alkalimarinus coralli TaxID=2935863 RepID=UPI00202B2D1E|nr:polysaccharide deacetylase family protein [Alkalimarinus coralli]
MGTLLLILYILLALFGLAAIWFSFRYAWWAKAVDYKHPRILMYHMVSDPKPGTKFNGLRVSPAMFEKQLQWLKQNNWNFVTMNQLVDDRSPLPEKNVALTFDDGYEDNYTQAFPLMKKYGAKGTLYLVINRHNNDWSTKKKAHHNSGELVREPKLSDEQVNEMVASGVFEIGGHTTNHINLDTVDKPTKYAEMSQSKAMLEKQLNTPINSFAYPFGIYSKEDPVIAKELGYTNAVLAEGGIETDVNKHRFELRRVKISGKDNFLAFKMRIKTGKRGWKK